MNKEETLFGDDWPFSKAKTALIRSAAEVMCEQGPRSTTLKNITVKTGVTEPAIFRHFDGVNGVFQSLYEVVDNFYNYFVTCFTNNETAGIDKLETSLNTIFEVLKDFPCYAYLLGYPDSVMRQYPKLKVKLNALEAKFSDAIKSCIKEAKSGGQLVSTADPDTATQIVIGAFYQIISLWIDNIKGFDLTKDGKKIIAAMCALIRDPSAQPIVPKKGRGKKA